MENGVMKSAVIKPESVLTFDGDFENT